MSERAVEIRDLGATLEGDLAVPEAARGVVVFAHGSGSGRFSPRNRAMAQDRARASGCDRRRGAAALRHGDAHADLEDAQHVGRRHRLSHRGDSSVAGLRPQAARAALSPRRGGLSL
jgi:hypothetical protein